MGLINNLKDKFNKAEFTVAPQKKLKTLSKEFLDVYVSKCSSSYVPNWDIQPPMLTPFVKPSNVRMGMSCLL